MSLAKAQRVVRTVDAAAATDLDHYYYTDEGPSACEGQTCEMAALVDWNPMAADQCAAIPEIGLIDTAVDLNHRALKGQSIDVVEIAKEGARTSQPDHGTAIAALLAGRSDSGIPGLLPKVKIVSVDAFSNDGGGRDRTDVVALVKALEALAERQVRIINMSLSGPPNNVLKQAIQAAQKKGIIIIAAAGNNGPGAEPSYPAAYEGVIAVTAVDHQRKVYSRATRGPYVDLAAPGVGIRTASATETVAVRSGTSYAVPYITAAAALARAHDPGMDVAQVRARLEESAQDLGEPGRDTTYGYGLIQMSRLCMLPNDEQPVAQSQHALDMGVP
ncbi:S8 family serine peptidase [Microvirga guangxiensis]|uniref:Subtilase family protein n=1 Tax=Microvirga guangxiensis TaxID=549386 RepID=A0A1G5I2U5_9HYPH|nr:S8 family serine peptidase [Microvirga guangxiensis]SCY70445.1 Subtilase family protein [Microvirga guangxiensis]